MAEPENTTAAGRDLGHPRSSSPNLTRPWPGMETAPCSGRGRRRYAPGWVATPIQAFAVPLALRGTKVTATGTSAVAGS